MHCRRQSPIKLFQDRSTTLVKSGGVRVIYYFHSEAMPLYLLTLFAKNERANLSKAKRNGLAALVDVLVQAWFER